MRPSILALCTLIALRLAVPSPPKLPPAGGVWTPVPPIGQQPPPRMRHFFVYDPSVAQLVMGAGATDGGAGQPDLSFLSDSWTFDGGQWAPDQPLPIALAAGAASMAKQLNGEGVLLAGGGTWSDAGTAQLSGSWLWQPGAGWAQVDNLQPPPRVGAGMAFDPVNQITVLFGGYDLATGTLLQDTWVWNGTNWTMGSPGPSPRFDALMTYDSSKGVILLYGGDPGKPTDPLASHSCLNDFWSWSGGTWSLNVAGSGTVGDTRCGAAMTYDPVDKLTLLFGGLTVGGTMPPGGQLVAWDGNSWTSVQNTGLPPSPRAYAAFAWDDALTSGFVFGGVDVLGPSTFYDPTTYQLQIIAPVFPDAGFPDAGGFDASGFPDANGFPDAGTTNDDGGSTDAGTASDGGSASDAGQASDAGGPPDAGTPGTDSGQPLADSGTPTADAGSSDAGSQGGDSGVPSDGGLVADGGGDDGSVIPIADLGCGCGSASGAELGLLGALTALIARRRRRQNENT